MNSTSHPSVPTSSVPTSSVPSSPDGNYAEQPASAPQPGQYAPPASSYDAQSGHAPQTGYYDPQTGYYDPQTGYTQPAYQAPSEPRTLSITSFSLGIASVLFSFTFLVPVAAIVLGFLARTREPAGRTLATWGIVLGFVMAVGWALGLLAFGGIAIAAIPFLAVL